MRDTVNYDLIVVMDAYDRAEVVREVSKVGREGWVLLRQQQRFKRSAGTC